MKQVPVSILTLIAGVVVALISLWVGQHHGLLPEQASEQALLVDNFFNLMVTIATALFLVVEGAIVIFVIQYRRKPGDDTDGDPTEGNIPLEIVWTAVPSIIVIGLGIYSVQVYSDMGGFAPTHQAMMAHHQTPASEHSIMGSAIAAPLATDPEPSTAASSAAVAYTYGIGSTPEAENAAAGLTVNVTGLQYAWIFNYPDNGAISGELHVPVGQSIQLNISAQDVIHSFWAPQLRLKQDAIPGQDTQLQFVVTKPGDYPIVCAELCGSYHGSMRTRLIAHTPEAFSEWLESNRVAQQPNLDQAVAENLGDLSDSDYLAPYAREIDLDRQTVIELHRY